MFIEKDGEIKVELHVRKFRNGAVRVEQRIEDVAEKDRAAFEKVCFTMRPLTWRQHNEIQRAATVTRPGMGSDLDWVTYKERKLCTVLVGWDAKGKDGKPIPVSDDNVLKLAPQVAETLLSEFDQATIMGDEERKNS
jgi:polyphosphate kinase 2 (PPK2 family)